MGLKIKNFQELFNSLVTWITAENTGLSDFNIGSALRTLIEAFSLQLEEFYFNMKQNIEYASRTAIYGAFGFEAIKSEFASGYIRVRFTQPLESSLILPSGMMFSTSLSNTRVVYYKTTDDITVEEGASEILIEVVCTESGVIGNCESGEINTLITGNSLILSVYNTARFTSGVDAESAASMRERFKEYLKSLGRATAESIAYGAKTVEGVAGVYVDDKYIGFVNLYCHDKNGDLPEELKNEITLTLEKYRAGGIEVKVLPIVKHKINLDITAVLYDSVDKDTMKESIQNSLISYLNTYTVSQDFFVADIITTLMSSYKGIIVTLDFNNADNVKILSNELVIAGSVNVTCISQSDWR